MSEAYRTPPHLSQDSLYKGDLKSQRGFSWLNKCKNVLITLKKQIDHTPLLLRVSGFKRPSFKCSAVTTGCDYIITHLTGEESPEAEDGG